MNISIGKLCITFTGLVTHPPPHTHTIPVTSKLLPGPGLGHANTFIPMSARISCKTHILFTVRIRIQRVEGGGGGRRVEGGWGRVEGG